MDIYLPKESATLLKLKKKVKQRNQIIRQTNIDKYRESTQLISDASLKENLVNISPNISILYLDLTMTYSHFRS